MDTRKAQFSSMDDYIAAAPDAIRPLLETLRQMIRDIVPEAGEAIKYGMPTFTFHGNLISFAAWKQHLSLYPNAATDALKAAFPELERYTQSGKGTIQFPLDEPLPLDLIQRIIAFQKDQMLAKHAARGKKPKA